MKPRKEYLIILLKGGKKMKTLFNYNKLKKEDQKFVLSEIRKEASYETIVCVIAAAIVPTVFFKIGFLVGALIIHYKKYKPTQEKIKELLEYAEIEDDVVRIV